MDYRYSNSRSFSEVCRNRYGRRVIYTNAAEINETNIVKELSKALTIHWINREQIDYLDKYYSGDQPILYRVKNIRKDINNRIVENHAFEIVEHKTAEMFGEPVQYVLKGTDDKKTLSIKKLNDYMDYEDKGAVDIELGRWRSICGTSYRFIFPDVDAGYEDEAPFSISCEDPRNTFIVYSSLPGNRPVFSVQCRKDEKGQQYYFIYTQKQTFEVLNSKIIRSGANGIGYIPVIEYPNNDRRLSDIEIVISLLDEINKMQSDRMNGIEQFVQALIKFVNCEIDESGFLEMLNLGAVKVKGNANTRADVDIMSAELDQQQTQVAMDDVYRKVLSISGMPSREQNTGGDTGQAVYLRNGWDFSEKRAELSEPYFKRSERNFLKVALRILRVNEDADLKVSDIEIKITRSKTDNMLVKAQVLQYLLAVGMEPGRAIKTCNLWSDPTQAYLDSKQYLDAKYSPDANNEGGVDDGKANKDNPLPVV